ncbi:transposase [Paraburkholderia elongata]|uniref:transposase n=1 Tax=Paraburkholderia elongata TaxID=2675747 RepID=UPI0038B29C62
MMQHPQARRIFSQRKPIVEPVFSSLRSQQGLNRFRRRGLRAVKREFALHVLARNLSRAVALLAALVALLYAVLGRLGQAVHDFLERARQPAGLRHQSYPRPGFLREHSRNVLRRPLKAEVFRLPVDKLRRMERAARSHE